MTSDDARNYFAEKGLTYEAVTEGDIGVLFILLNKHVKQANNAGNKFARIVLNEFGGKG